MPETPRASHHRWADLPREQVTETLARRMVAGERVMLAELRLERGCVVPLHSHENEQLSHVLTGALRFHLGPETGEEVVVRAGEVLVIPSHLPHRVEALEDTLAIDVFSPPRRDWLDGTDDYLRRK